MFVLYDEYGFENIKKQVDISLFIDVDEEKCHHRLVARKVEVLNAFGSQQQGGRSREDSEKHYERVDKVNIMRIIGRKNRADILLKVDDGNLFSSLEFGSIS